MKKPLSTSLALVLAALSAQAATYDLDSNIADQERHGDGAAQWVGQSTARIGMGVASGSAFVFVFELPTLGAGETISAANFDTTVTQANVFNDPIEWNIDLYGVRSSNSSTVLAADFFMDANDASATMLQDNFWAGLDVQANAPAVGEHSTSIAGDAALTAWLNSLYTGSTPDAAYAFLRMNGDLIAGSMQASRWVTIETGNGTNLPGLQITTTVPEPSTYAALAGLVALGSVMLRRRRA